MNDAARIALLIEDEFDDDEVERITTAFRDALHEISLVALCAVNTPRSSTTGRST